jgi:hypothetical protein
MAAYTGQAVTWQDAMESAEDLNPAPITWGPRAVPELAIPGKLKSS